MATETRTRAKGADLPSWWMIKVREIVEDRKETMGESLVELGALLADAVGRPTAWNHSSVSRFLNEDNPTVDMAEAFVALLGIPRPFFTPRSMEEALAMQQVARRYDAKQLTTDQVQRIAAVDQALGAAEREIKDQTHPLESQDEVRGGGSRRVGRSVRGRS